MIINRAKRWLVITPPRTGSHSLNRLLSTETFGGTVTKHNGQDHHESDVPEWAAGFRAFILVRNPYARASSLFRWGLENHLAYVETGPIPCFSRFVREAMIGRSWPEFFYRTISSYSSAQTIPLRLERLGRDLQSLEPRGQYHVTHENRDVQGIPWHRSYQDDPAARELVVEWASDDFERFGYPVTPAWSGST